MGLILVAVLGPTLFNLILAIAITAVPAFIRVARGSTLAMKERDFVDACRALGYGDLRIMFLHVLPNIMDEVVVMGSLWLAAAIRTESTLAFIGLGVPPPTATWGGIIREGFDNLLDAPWLSIFPSLAILVVMIALNLDRRRPARRHRPEDAAVSVAAAAAAPAPSAEPAAITVEGLTTSIRIAAPLVRRGARRQLRGPPPRDAGACRRVGLRQEPDGAVGHGPAAGRRRPHLERAHRGRRRRHDGGERGRQAGDARRTASA